MDWTFLGKVFGAAIVEYLQVKEVFRKNENKKKINKNINDTIFDIILEYFEKKDY